MRELQYPFDGNWIIQNRRKIRKQLLNDETTRVSKKIAILGGSTTHDIVKILELFLLDAGIMPIFYESEYGRYYEDAVFGNPELDTFQPDLIFIHTSNRNIQQYPDLNQSKEDILSMLDQQFERFAHMWTQIRTRYNCTIIQNNFDFPAYRLMGNRDATDIHGRVNYIQRFNQKFAAYADTHNDFYIHDIQYLSAEYGLDKWQDPSFWYMYKYALCVPAIPLFAHSLCCMIKSVFGKNKKALVLDLDNTLWGGVVGDDGVDGIEIGHETSLGQGYLEFQNYIRAHRDLGVILNVSSKNDYDNALQGLNHPSGVLKPEDFTVIKANWEAKSENIRSIAQELNVLPDSLVFVDDNPAEREIVRTFIPEVVAPEMNHVETYISVLDRSGFFEVTSFSEDDRKRNDMYRANFARNASLASFTDYNAYLKSLEMKGTIRDFEPLYLPRITQLTNKSNQFNLTTKRYTESEMEQISKDDSYIRLYGRLEDRFGDNGIVSVVIGKKQEIVLHVELWLMSCRVLKRNMEYAMLDTLVSKCRMHGIREIRGYYYPTAKNGMVRDLYAQFGFSLVHQGEDGSSVWKLDVLQYTQHNDVIDVVE